MANPISRVGFQRLANQRKHVVVRRQFHEFRPIDFHRATRSSPFPFPGVWRVGLRPGRSGRSKAFAQQIHLGTRGEPTGPSGYRRGTGNRNQAQERRPQPMIPSPAQPANRAQNYPPPQPAARTARYRNQMERKAPKDNLLPPKFPMLFPRQGAEAWGSQMGLGSDYGNAVPPPASGLSAPIEPVSTP